MRLKLVAFCLILGVF
uniref:Uncharacterized protein n=1 Tax=Rhizophora mucronata TaxID=61149 RepID=A0A2P2QRM6_RHIMU